MESFIETTGTDSQNSSGSDEELHNATDISLNHNNTTNDVTFASDASKSNALDDGSSGAVTLAPEATSESALQHSSVKRRSPFDVASLLNLEQECTSKTETNAQPDVETATVVQDSVENTAAEQETLKADAPEVEVGKDTVEKSREESMEVEEGDVIKSNGPIITVEKAEDEEKKMDTGSEVEEEKSKKEEKIKEKVEIEKECLQQKENVETQQVEIKTGEEKVEEEKREVDGKDDEQQPEVKPTNNRKRATAKTPRGKAKAGGGRPRKTPARTPSATLRRTTRATRTCPAEEDPDKTLTAEPKEEQVIPEDESKPEAEVDSVASHLRSSRRAKLTALERVKEEERKESSGTEEYSHNEDADVSSVPPPNITSTPKPAGACLFARFPSKYEKRIKTAMNV